ncbi:N-acetylmuramoyl-L-alanine amidase [uncultured Ruegeria sp.]|uniref:N-acetylmuramoyl-L-alanine amidase n=1 Tax=uncultured Ruegeria sp. TaxID=259304 RepID=UPI002622A605|nr:N-acetylmuramoyl-L-alanine amidase [uncultured Ruegeria sp.]
MSFLDGWHSDATRKSLVHNGNNYAPRQICIHYTVTDNVQAALNALDSRKLSYHLLVERDGSVTQTRPMTEHAAHGGYANWKTTSGMANSNSLNRTAATISLVSRGFFGKKSGQSAYDVNAHGDPVGKFYPISETSTEGSIYHPKGARHWHKYTDAQLATCQKLIADLLDAYSDITELVGHDDMCIDAKFDPGPLFPIQQFRDELDLNGSMGFLTEVQSPDGELNLRQRPTSNSSKLATLHNGDPVHIRSVVYTTKPGRAIWADRVRYRYLTGWASVDVHGANRHSGFVHMRFLRSTPLAANYQNRL